MNVSRALGSQPWVPGDARTAGVMSSQLLGRPSKHHSGCQPAASSSPTRESRRSVFRLPVLISRSASSASMTLRAAEASR